MLPRPRRRHPRRSRRARTSPGRRCWPAGARWSPSPASPSLPAGAPHLVSFSFPLPLTPRSQIIASGPWVGVGSDPRCLYHNIGDGASSLTADSRLDLRERGNLTEWVCPAFRLDARVTAGVEIG